LGKGGGVNWLSQVLDGGGDFRVMACRVLGAHVVQCYDKNCGMGIAGLLLDTDASGSGEKFGHGKVDVEAQGRANFLEFLKEGDGVQGVLEAGSIIDIPFGGVTRAVSLDLGLLDWPCFVNASYVTGTCT
jgi:hypothetical protein